MDSDLEAFSHNPTDGSFTALSVLTTVFTKYLNTWGLRKGLAHTPRMDERTLAMGVRQAQ